MSKLQLVLPLHIGKLILRDIGKIYAGRHLDRVGGSSILFLSSSSSPFFTSMSTSPLLQYFHVVKDIKYPTPVGYLIEKQVRNPATEENLIFQLSVTEGQHGGPWYVVRVLPENRDASKEVKAEGRSPTSVGNTIYERVGVASKVSGPVFFGWEVREICYLFQQLAEGNLEVSYDEGKRNYFTFPPSVARKRETSPTRSSQKRKAATLTDEDDEAEDNLEGTRESSTIPNLPSAVSRKLKMPQGAEVGTGEVTGEAPTLDEIEGRRRKKGTRAKRASREDREGTEDTTDHEAIRFMTLAENQIDALEDFGAPRDVEHGADRTSGLAGPLSSEDRMRKRQSEERIRWAVFSHELSRRKPKKRQEWKERMEAKLKRVSLRSSNQSIEKRLREKLASLTK